MALAQCPEVSTPAEDAVSVNPAKATVTMVAAVTGTVDEVGDRIVIAAVPRLDANRPNR